MSLSLVKRALRKSLLLRRDQLCPDDVERKSLQAQSRLIGLAAFRGAETLALYSPIRNEVETAKLIEVALSAQKRVCFPCVTEEGLNFFQVESPADLKAGCFDICEPASRRAEVGLSEIDLLLVPGVAFDRCGTRLGYGKGYFDRLLSDKQFSGLSVGFAYDFQIEEKLPTEGHDRPVALLVTDKKIYSPLSSD